jgi:hypothetical protein
MKGLRTVIAFLLTMLCASVVWGGEQILLQKAQGEVLIRPGVAETWVQARAGDQLRPDATIKIGKQSTAVLVLPAVNKKISLPPEVMVDISDIRELSPEELMLKLTMERVRASSYEWKKKELELPGTTAFRGEERERHADVRDGDLEEGRFQLNGTRVLYNNGFYSTSALRALDVLRRYPALSSFESRLLIAEALQKAQLKGEALTEYVALSRLSDLTPDQQALLASRIAELKKN